MIREPKIHFLVVLGTALLFLICSVAPASAADISSTSFSNPFITIDPIGNHTIGDVFFINGTTNLPVTDTLTIHIRPLTPQHGGRGRLPLGIYVDRIPIVSDSNGINHWSANVTDGYWREEQRFVASVWSTTFIPPNESLFPVFIMFEPNNTTPIQRPRTISTPVQITPTSSTPPSPAETIVSVIPVATTSQAAPLPVIVSIIGIFTGGIVFSNSINCRKRK